MEIKQEPIVEALPSAITEGSMWLTFSHVDHEASSFSGRRQVGILLTSDDIETLLPQLESVVAKLREVGK